MHSVRRGDECEMEGMHCKHHQANNIHTLCRTSAGTFTNDKTISIKKKKCCLHNSRIALHERCAFHSIIPRAMCSVLAMVLWNLCVCCVQSTLCETRVNFVYTLHPLQSASPIEWILMPVCHCSFVVHSELCQFMSWTHSTNVIAYEIE